MREVEVEILKNLKKFYLQKKLDGKQIFLFGYNIYTELIYCWLDKMGYKLYEILDNDKKKQGRYICNTLVVDPESITWDSSKVILVASQHRKRMTWQIRQISDEVEIVVLADIKKEAFWIDENYRQEVQQLYQGAEIYRKLKKEEELIIFPIPSLGDIFAGGLYLEGYCKGRTNSVKIVIASKGAYEVAQLFGIENIVMVTREEIRSLAKYVFFNRAGNDIVCSWVPLLCEMALYKGIVFPKYWAKYFFRLNENYRLNFPIIWDEKLKEEDLIKLGMKKKRSVIIAPYANSVQELPLQFWDLLVKSLIEKNFYVFTNKIGEQHPVKGSKGLEIPLKQIGNYLEFAGYFVSIRSGLCEVAGRARCKQIILFRDESESGIPEIEHYNLHSENISLNAFQYVYDDSDLIKNVNVILNCILNERNM